MEVLYEEYIKNIRDLPRVVLVDVCLQRKLPRYIVTYKVEPGDKQALFNALDLVMEMSDKLGIEDFHYYKENWYVEITTRSGDAFKFIDVYEAPEFDESKFNEEETVEMLRKIEDVITERNKLQAEDSDDSM